MVEQMLYFSEDIKYFLAEGHFPCHRFYSAQIKCWLKPLGWVALGTHHTHCILWNRSRHHDDRVKEGCSNLVQQPTIINQTMTLPWNCKETTENPPVRIRLPSWLVFNSYLLSVLWLPMFFLSLTHRFHAQFHHISCLPMFALLGFVLYVSYACL